MTGHLIQENQWHLVHLKSNFVWHLNVAYYIYTTSNRMWDVLKGRWLSKINKSVDLKYIAQNVCTIFVLKHFMVYFLCMEKSSMSILQNSSFCAPWKWVIQFGSWPAVDIDSDSVLVMLLWFELSIQLWPLPSQSECSSGLDDPTLVLFFYLLSVKFLFSISLLLTLFS